MSQQAVAQLSMFGAFDAGLNRVFKTDEIKDKSGNIIGATMTFKPRKEIAAAFDLKNNKENSEKITEALLRESDAALTKAKQHMAGLNGDNTLRKFSVRTLANGIRQTTIVTQEISRKQRLSDEKVAEGMFPTELYPAMTLEEKLAGVVEARARQEAHLAKNLIDAKSEITTAPENPAAPAA